jgi:hypothetical protein
MAELKQDKKLVFTGSETFIGNTLEQEKESHNKTYRFMILSNDRGILEAIPEVSLHNSNEWKRACPGWRLEDIIGSTGLFFRFRKEEIY